MEIDFSDEPAYGDTEDKVKVTLYLPKAAKEILDRGRANKHKVSNILTKNATEAILARADHWAKPAKRKSAS